ncbi:hypothetical protein EV359DRAFT_42295 [Lentinula novae-zelandiae]|nr:hypothetical protein EV359DRAFT_42295 [Lentinula novae-zelandiae]
MSTRKKSQRKRIPAALHSELTEYSSLLRSLRTNDTLDVTSQLTRYFNHKGKEKAQISDDTYDDDDSECINDGDRKRASRPQSLASEDIMTTKAKTSTHETWTRWPLLAQDVPFPEWTLQDEVAHITAFLLRDTSSSPSDVDSDPNSSNSSLISTLTLSSSRYLDSILASLAAIIPKRSVSMINRLAPAGWQSVLAAAQLQASGGSSTKYVRPLYYIVLHIYFFPSVTLFVNKKGTRTRSEKTGRYIRVTVTPTYNCRVIQQKSCQYGNDQL